jgi:lysozyme family protein
MSSFDEAIKHVLAMEGGWVNDPHDLGAETNFGWSTLTIKNLHLTEFDLCIPGPMFAPGYLKPMPVMAAIHLYKVHFWDKCGFQAIIDQTCATKCFDASVNMGPKRACKNCQGAVNILTPGKLIVDGSWGPKTFGAINALDPAKFIKAYSNTLADYYESIIKARPANAKFRKNWLRRAKWGMP